MVLKLYARIFYWYKKFEKTHRYKQRNNVCSMAFNKIKGLVFVRR